MQCAIGSSSGDHRPTPNWRALPSISVLVLLLVGGLAQGLAAQAFQVIHSFTGGNDGSYPLAGLTLDRGGNLYGTASDGGAKRIGVVFKMTRAGAGWTLNPLYSFGATQFDGVFPSGRVVFGPDGALYGTTSEGGTNYAGTLFKLQPPTSACRSVVCPWNETILHMFPDPVQTDGFYPFGDLAFDAEGNILGTTSAGGAGAPYGCQGLGCGVVYKFPRTGNETILYAFTGASDGGDPYGGVVLDPSGNMYGTVATAGANNAGGVFQLTPNGPGWTESLYPMPSQDGIYPNQGVVRDPAGNLYTTASGGGPRGAGTAFELQGAGGGWNFQLLYNFGTGDSGLVPSGTMTMDAAGNLYGVVNLGGASDRGAVFELSPSNGGWTYRSLHDFTGGSDGAYPFGNVAFDPNGNLYGTAANGGSQNCHNGCGVVWEITP